MGSSETSQDASIRILLAPEELQFPAIDKLCENFQEWLELSKDADGRSTRKTRSANKKADILYEEIMAFKIHPIKLNSPITRPQFSASSSKNHSADTSINSDSDSSSTRPITRSLRPRSRTPTVTSNHNSIRPTTPCTPTHQRIRAEMRQPNSGTSVLSAALSQGHPKVSVTKIKQAIKFTDSVQKKRADEKERQARLIYERKLKEERAEAQKRQLLEERAENAKQNREKRLNHAAELRKARDQAKAQQKLIEQEARKAQLAMLMETKPVQQPNIPIPDKQQNVAKEPKIDQPKTDQPQTSQPKPNAPAKNLNETFKKPSEEVNNINISIQDETSDEIQKEKVPATAMWTRAPHLRDALIAQFSKSDEERQADVMKIIPPVQLPVDLDKIFGSGKAVNTRYLSRTSSAVWTPPNRAIKRSSSMLTTPNGPNS